MIFRLAADDPRFPDPLLVPAEYREENGLYAIGGDLSPERLIEAYRQGIFPWTAFRRLDVKPGQRRRPWNELHWYCPLQRFVIFPQEVHVSHSMRTLMRKAVYQVSFDRCFEQVIGHCSQLRINESGAWLGPKMVEAYCRLHRMGVAHSVEVWKDDELVGGLYGVCLLGGFFGESMFSLVPSASKLALISLCRLLQEQGGKFVDCQFETPHLKSMGGRYITYEAYMRLLYAPGTGEE